MRKAKELHQLRFNAQPRTSNSAMRESAVADTQFGRPDSCNCSAFLSRPLRVFRKTKSGQNSPVEPPLMRTVHQSLITIHCVLASASTLFAQGSLTPPSPPGPAMLTLDQLATKVGQVEKRIPVDAVHTPASGNSAFTITAPGSYYLTGNIALNDKTKNAINITAAGVSLDLNGFHISNNAAVTDSTGAAGVAIGGQSCIVKNGTISGFPSGVLGSTGNSTQPLGAIVADLNVQACRSGIELSGTGSIVRNCAVTSCFFGISVGVGSKVEHCASSNNMGHGISASTYSAVIGCTAQGNGNQGSSPGGIVVDSGSTVANCSAGNNTGVIGIQAGASCLVSNCTANQNAAGIEVSLRSTVVNCTASDNAFQEGIRAASNQASQADISVLHCTADGNRQGINMGTGCTISDCTVGHNFFEGILAGFGCTIRHCTARFNGDSGFFFTGGCYVADNVADSNNQNGDSPVNIRVAGFYAFSNSNRIEGNSATFNPNCPGITVEGANNLLLHNSARGNTPNYKLATNNRYGPIVDLTSNPNFGPVNGNLAGSTLNDNQGGSHPWANYAY
jgi:parallel beta-helix repeat protein